jgi:N-acetylglutamate synthase-like GNAT family acetyltransferase
MIPTTDLSDMRIRPALEADAPIIHQMIRNAQLDPTSLDWHNFLVAEVDRQIVGIGQIKPYRDCQELGSLVVRREHRNRGIASALIEALEARAGRPLYLVCQLKMEPYYLRFGYKRVPFLQVPPTIRLKLAAAFAFRLFGIKVIAMRKD